MAVLATIHQPSAELFMCFDRVISLSEGYTIYNGPPRKITDYFSQFGLKVTRYSNPADKLSSIASEPRQTLNPNITILELYRQCEIQLSQYKIRPQDDEDAQTILVSSRHSRIVQTRTVSFGKQYCLLLRRFLTQVYRVPLALFALVFMGFFQGIT